MRITRRGVVGAVRDGKETLGLRFCEIPMPHMRPIVMRLSNVPFSAAVFSNTENFDGDLARNMSGGGFVERKRER